MDFIILMKPHPHNIFNPFVLYLDESDKNRGKIGCLLPKPFIRLRSSEYGGVGTPWH